MSKIKMPMNRVSGLADVSLSCGYCELQEFLSSFEPFCYNSGIYGWNNDTYLIPCVFGETHIWVTITTGYRNIKGTRISPEMVKSLNAAARILKREPSRTTKTIKGSLSSILYNLIIEYNL